MQIKTINDLRCVLAEEIEKLRKGETNSANVSAISSASARILATIRMELDYAKSRKEEPNIPMLAQPKNETETKQLNGPQPDETH